MQQSQSQSLSQRERGSAAGLAGLARGKRDYRITDSRLGVFELCGTSGQLSDVGNKVLLFLNADKGVTLVGPDPRASTLSDTQTLLVLDPRPPSNHLGPIPSMMHGFE